ncbi:hypothetical protein ACHQM5_015665 [Ranunculus cassubicifolius]
MNTINRGKETMSDESSMREDIMQHPLFNDLLAAHAACTRVTATSSVDHSPVVAHTPLLCTSLNGELDQFMASYITMLTSLENKILRPCIMEATMAFQSIEQELFDLFATEEKTNMASGSTMPTGSVKSLADMMKQELKLKLQEDYEVKIKHLWEEIKMKRAGAAHKLPLPSNVSSVLKKWWEEHLEWPYPTGDEKEMLMKETGLQLKQLNKWFINQRNRNRN